MIIAGIDLSLTSPGLVVHDTDTKTITAYFYPARKRNRNIKLEVETEYAGGTLFKLVPIPGKPGAGMSLVDRYAQISKDIVDRIPLSARVLLEGYAFESRSSSASKLHELGGILKFRLFCRDRTRCEEVPPARLKKFFTGSGRADKLDMHTHFVTRGFPNLMECFGFSDCKGCPNPVQDIVDAFTLVAFASEQPFCQSFKKKPNDRSKEKTNRTTKDLTKTTVQKK